MFTSIAPFDVVVAIVVLFTSAVVAVSICVVVPGSDSVSVLIIVFFD